MEMFVANTTRQDHDLKWRVPNRATSLVRPIPRGSQIRFEGSKEELEAIVAQHRKFGMMDVKDIGRLNLKEAMRTRQFSGLVFSMGKVINVDQIMQGLELKDDMADANANQVRENAVAAMSEHLNQAAAEVSSELRATGLVTEIEEVTADRESKGKRLKQKLDVDATTRSRGRGQKTQH